MNVDIDIRDFLRNCDDWDIKEIVEYLVDHKHIRRQDIDEDYEDKNIMDLEWDKTIDKLSTLRLQLTPQEEEIIKQITNKY